MSFDSCKWVDNQVITTTPTTNYWYYYDCTPRNLYTWRYGDSGDLEIGLPGVTKKDLELKIDTGVLSIIVSGKIVFTFPVASDVVSIRGKISEGLLTIKLEKKKEECPVSLE